MSDLYPTKRVDRLIDSQFESLDQAIAHIKQLEHSNTVLQQKINYQAESLEQQSQQIDTMQAESKRMQQHLIQMEKMALLGQMVSGISHEINNPINFIYGNLPYVEEHVKDLLTVLQAYQQSDSERSPLVQKALQAVELDFVLEDLPRIVASMKLGADRVRSLVLTLRNFYRLDEPEMKPADMHQGIENTLLLLQHRYKQAITIVKEFGELPLVECHINQINQVFMNLLSNAIDALAELQPNTYQELLTSAAPIATITITTQPLGDDRVAIGISDNGPGIPLEVQRRLFDPFFTTKPMGVGTGLGLSISHQIVTETHQGQIYCCSTPGGGTTFMVELPIWQTGEAEDAAHR